MPIRPATARCPGCARVAADAGPLYLANALIGFIFAASGPVAIILSVGAARWARRRWRRGSSARSSSTASSLLFFARYRQPLVFF